MNRIIIVSGTPGTGKTTLAKFISQEFGHEYVDVNEIMENKNLIEGFDKEKDCNIVDEEKLAEVLKDIIKSSDKDKKIIIDSHLSYYIDSKFVDLCIITRCELRELEKRLQNKGYKEDKVKENMQCEIMEICLTEAKENNHNVKEFDMTNEIKKEDVKNLIE